MEGVAGMFGIGETEFVLILIFAFLLFGPDKLPAMGRTIGRGLRQFREAQDSVTKVVQSEVIDPLTAAANEGTKKVASKDELDADSDAQAAAPERPKETFAERKARLAREKAEAEAAKASPDASAEKDEAPAAASEPVAEPEPEPEAPKKPSAASLFGLDDSGKEDEA
jgi:TatA/E family protein of Tat protein translocase